jgi:hypothetical protein
MLFCSVRPEFSFSRGPVMSESKTEYGEKLLVIALLVMVAAACAFFLLRH